MIAACASVGANAPNGSPIKSLATDAALPDREADLVKIFSPKDQYCVCIADFTSSSNGALPVTPAFARTVARGSPAVREHDPDPQGPLAQSGYRFSLATNAGRVCAKIMLKQKYKV